MKNKYKLFGCVFLLLSFWNLSCKKYLDESPDKQLIIPKNVQDLQYLLDNYALSNLNFSGIAEILCDNYYFNFDNWRSSSESIRYYYTWTKYDNNQGDWATLYRSIYPVNVVLDNLPSIEYTPSEQDKLNEVKGAALFLRSYYFYFLAQLWAQPYDKNTASTDLGLPLRLNSDFNEVSTRSTVLQTYERIVNDLKEAIALLPVVPTYKNRPAKPAAYAALAKTYLAMQDYVKAGLYADSCLQLKNNLMPYDSLTASNPILEYNPEVIFHGRTGGGISSSKYFVDSALYQSYDMNDLRKKIFYRSNGNGTFRPKGNYCGIAGSSFFFAGLATNEMYLIRAESAARASDKTSALNDLNILLEKRWITANWVPFTALDAQEALQIILRERRKELVFTLTRWSDLRRLNKEPAFATTIWRILNGQSYSLAPNAPGYTLQIPKAVIDKTSMQQNP